MELVIIIILSRVMTFPHLLLGENKWKCPELTANTFSEYSRQCQSPGALSPALGCVGRPSWWGCFLGGKVTPGHMSILDSVGVTFSYFQNYSPSSSSPPDIGGVDNIDHGRLAS